MCPAAYCSAVSRMIRMRSSMSPHTSSRTTLLFFTDAATPEIYTLSLHDALPSSSRPAPSASCGSGCFRSRPSSLPISRRSEEHTSELQSHHDLVCRLLLEKKKINPLLGYPQTSNVARSTAHNITLTTGHVADRQT